MCNSRGAILNNARTDVQTQLGGWIQGNPWLAGGTARVILNEVNSSNPSLLHGYVEVAGSRAQVVIANPAGISCDGCGFINANRATLTTGTPIVNGGNLDGYRVQRGEITISGAGLDASHSDYTDLIARAVQVNAGIWAHQLKITTGTNQVDANHTRATAIAGTGGAPAFAIDVAQLGGMYAGKITLVGTEAGVGVRNAGTIGASAGEVIVTAAGRLENAGYITSNGQTRIDSDGGIQNSGTVHAQGDARLSTRGDIDNSGVIAAQGSATLAATGADSRISSTGGSVLGAGVQSDGSLGSGGALSVSATQAISAQGRNLSGGDQSLTAQSLNLAGSQTSARNISLTAGSGDLDASGATLAAGQTLTAQAGQTLRTDRATISATQILVAAHDLSNVQGDIQQTGSGDLALDLPGSLDNSQGQIASNSRNLRLTAATLTNTGGKLEHAGSGTLKVDVATLNGTRGQIGSNGLLDLTATSATLDAASTIAGQLQIDSATLSNRGGALIQTGGAAASISAATLLDNGGGTLASSGSTTLAVGNLDNRGGVIQASGAGADLDISTDGQIDNSAQGGIAGALAASGDTRLTATRLVNTQGQITAGRALSVTATQALSNTQGLLAANRQADVSAGQIDNSHGTIGSVQGRTNVTATSGALDNTAGRIEGAESANVSSIGLTNSGGVITGSSLVLNSQAQTLDNTRGKLTTTGANDGGTLSIQSGALNNDAGLIQAQGTLTLDTHGQALDNSHSGNGGGILGQGSVTLATGDLTNSAGYIGSSGALTANGAALDNTQGGLIVSAAQLNLNGTALDNRGGQIQASGDVGIRLSGALNNTASLVRSGQTLGITADSIANAGTQGGNQGLQGQSVNLNARQINNQSGAILADDGLTLTSGGSIDNTRGLISSARTTTLQDADLAAKTLAITNSGGTLIAGQNLAVDSASLTGDGKVLSQGDLSVRLTQDYTQTRAGQLQANGTASLETAGTLTNQFKLLAGTALNLKAATIDNRANGKISADQVHLQATASHTLINRGLINGQDTVIETVTLDNLGSGRIYGDHVAIGANTVSNDAENGVAPVIAARNRLDIGAQTLNNREHALIFSAGDMAIGGGLDADKQATGQAATLNNSATIEALGTLDLAAGQINNTNEHFSTTVQSLGTEHVVEYQGSGSATRYKPGTPGVYVYNDQSDHLMTPERSYESWLKYSYDQTTTETKVQRSDPAQILSGGAMNIAAGTLLNDKSRIIAGGTLNGNIGTLDNTEVAGERTITDSGSVTSYWRDHQKGRDSTGSSVTGYHPPTTIQAISLTPTVYEQNTAPGGSAPQISTLSTGDITQSPSGAKAADVTIGSGPAISPITQVAALHGNNANGPATVVRSGGINTRVPDNSLFRLNPSPNAGYLVETDPSFASYRNWLSSDYMLNALSLDPATTQERLGDGFYEQKLVREQVALLTGRRFLDGYAGDEAQYRGLMDAGVTFAKAHQLVPGVALSAAQMAELTSDIVWLVAKNVTLPDGQTTKALVPQLYVRTQDGDLSASGALIGGGSVNLNVTGDLTNGGTIAGRDVVALTAENVKNLGGRISGNDVAVAARTDLADIGGRIAGVNSLTASAGRDLNVISTTRTQSNAQGSRTNVDRVAGLYVSGSGGTLVAAAGRDVNLDAAAILNTAAPAAETPAGSTVIAAGHDLNLGTVTEAASNSIAWGGKNRRKDSSRTDVGSTIQTEGDIRLQAGNDLNAQAANVTSDQGALLATAGRDVNLSAGKANVSVDETHQHEGTSSAFSSKTITTRDTLDQTTAQATTLSADSSTVLANRDINLKGSNVVSTRGALLSAQNNVNVEAATDATREGHFRDETKSGMFSSGGIGFTIGTQEQSADNQAAGNSAAASTVGSTQGDVAIQAGKNYRQVGSDVLAPQGNIDIHAQRADILAAQNTGRNSTETKFSQSGLTVAITSPVITAIQTARQMKEAASQTKDRRMKALAGANTALAAKNSYDSVAADPKAAGGISVSITVGGSSSKSKQTQTSSTAQGSTVAAGGNVNLSATGAGKDSDITVQGSTVKAGNDVTLKADNDINLLAAKNTAEQHSTNSSQSAGVGVAVSYGSGGFAAGFTANASAARGKADGHDTRWTNTHVEAGNKLALQSGGDTTLKGAVASGKQVQADVGGNLNIESLQDTSDYKSRNQSIGGSVTIGYGFAASVHAGQQKIDSDFASVGEQSGIKAGDGGFQVNVKGNTDLKGAVIASTDKAVQDGKNSFTTGTLSTSDIQNRAAYHASSVSIGGGFSKGSSMIPLGGGSAAGGVSGKQSPGNAGFGEDSGNAASTSRAGISALAGNKDVRTGDVETGVAPIFDAGQVQKNVDAQAAITQQFGTLAPKAAADYAAGRSKALRAQAAQETDPGKRAALLTEAKNWDEGGTYRVALHAALGGLAGGASGALGAGAAAGAAPLLNDLQDHVTQTLKDAGAGDTIAKAAGQVIAQTTAAGLGAAVSGGSTAGAAMAFNVDANNRQLDPDEYARARRMAKNKQLRDTLAKKEGRKISADEFEGRMVAETLRNSDRNASTQAGGIHDYDLRSIVGCQNLNCDGFKNDPQYDNSSFNAQYIAPNSNSYAKGISFDSNGLTYNQLVTKNIRNNPWSTAIAGAGMTTFGYLVAGPASLGVRTIAGGIGAGANYSIQKLGTQPTDWSDVGIAGFTGFITGSAENWVQGLGAASLINTGGALTGSTIKGENPNAGMGGAAIGTAIGYPLGKVLEGPLDKVFNSWDRPDWIPAGPFGVVKPNPPSVVPGAAGNMGSSTIQEFISNPTKDAINKAQGK